MQTSPELAFGGAGAKCMDFTQAKVILSREHFILSKSNGTLWCDRRDGRLTAGTGETPLVK